MRFQSRIFFLVVVAVITSASVQAAPPPGFTEAEATFNTTGSPDSRVFFHVLMTGAGYWNAVPNEGFSQRMFGAVQKLQNENGLRPTGAVDKVVIDKLIELAAPQFAQWQFRKVKHPTRPVSVWVPFGLGLSAERSGNGLTFSEPRKRVLLKFLSMPNTNIAQNFAIFIAGLQSEGVQIHYKVQRADWFAASFSLNGIDAYARYHQDGDSVTGFTLHWNNANGDVHGERIAVLMSGGLWSDMTGARFTNLTLETPSAPQNVAAQPPAVKEPAPKTTVSSGTGFFVSSDGAFVTNAHVIDGCSEVSVKTSDGLSKPARIAAQDTSNDLALLRVSGKPSAVAKLRVGVRLGEGVAAFGFPHADLLASSGNFTLGNVTALSGMGDDSRRFQISAPVQSGNSGGPLLDQNANVIGVVTSKLDAMKMASAKGDMPQNVNFALKAAILATFLESNGVIFQVGSLSDTAMQPPDIADRAKAVSGFVLCR